MAWIYLRVRYGAYPRMAWIYWIVRGGWSYPRMAWISGDVSGGGAVDPRHAWMGFPMNTGRCRGFSRLAAGWSANARMTGQTAVCPHGKPQTPLRSLLPHGKCLFPDHDNTRPGAILLRRRQCRCAGGRAALRRTQRHQPQPRLGGDARPPALVDGAAEGNAGPVHGVAEITQQPAAEPDIGTKRAALAARLSRPCGAYR